MTQGVKYDGAILFFFFNHDNGNFSGKCFHLTQKVGIK